MKNLMRLLFIFTMLSIVFACKNETKENSTATESEIIFEEMDQKGLKKSEKIEKSIVNSVVSKLMFTEEAKSFVRFLISAELIDKFSTEKGPFTIFAPTSDAFNSLNTEKLNSLQDYSNREFLSSILNSHIVEGELNTVLLVEEINKNNGNYNINTLSGSILTASKKGSMIYITDEKGTKATIGKSDIMGSNGVVHILDTVLGLD